MEEQNFGWAEAGPDRNGQFMSPEIVEVGEESRSVSKDGGANDVYVAVGRDDLDVLKWAIDHMVVPESRVFLVHVFPPVNNIPTPVGKLSRSQVGQDQVNAYIREEDTRRRNILQKYIRHCNDAKVAVDTMLIKSDMVAKAILELIPVLNINTLVMGTKRPFSRWLTKRLGTGELVQKSAPDFCEVVIVFNGKRVTDDEQVGMTNSSPKLNGQRATSKKHKAGMNRHSERKFFDCACFSGTSNSN
ncbi:hypothetical protein Syun_020435 [Stephania yunnanensis]|uniref:UspA domain-containing protein n=1 Tax=Stephania yunnanensis TaxID=152371 RepID=A0AAP0IDX6_9MAGN